MSNAFNYDSAIHHIEKRSALSEELRASVDQLQAQSGTRAQWIDHHRFAGEAQFWVQVHEALLRAVSQLPLRCTELLLVLDEPEARKKHITQFTQLASQFIHHAHTHQHVVEHQFLPIIRRDFPELQHHLDLLNGDHRILTEGLDQLESAVQSLSAARGETDQSKQSALAATANALYATAKRVDALFCRHTADEEEICIPALLQMRV